MNFLFFVEPNGNLKSSLPGQRFVCFSWRSTCQRDCDGEVQPHVLSTLPRSLLDFTHTHIHPHTVCCGPISKLMDCYTSRNRVITFNLCSVRSNRKEDSQKWSARWCIGVPLKPYPLIEADDQWSISILDCRNQLILFKLVNLIRLDVQPK